MAGVSWTGLVDAAVMGTGRAAQLPGAALEAIVLDAGDDQAMLLHSAAVVSRARRAGYRPPEAGQSTAPAPAEDDHRPEVCPAAERRLADLLGAGDHNLIAEWLRCLAALDRAKRPPDALVPALLTAAAGRPVLRASLLPVLGPLAGWLAGFNGEWAALLGKLRSSDPAAGRELVAATWDVDSYRDRAAFLAILAVGLSPDDEPTAERALADRRAEVRRAAADLLARLPGSRYSQRAAARAAAAVRIERQGLRQRLVLRIPDRVTPQMQADGVDGSPPRRTGASAWLLRQMVAAAPATFWAGHTGLEPGELLALADRSEWTEPLRAGWTAAAVRDADRAWLLALLDQPAPARPDTERHVTADLRLFTALDADARDAWLRANSGSPLFAAALEVLPAPWSVPLSDLVRRRLSSVARADPGYSAAPRALIRLAALRLEPHMINTLSVRADMRRELSEELDP